VSTPSATIYSARLPPGPVGCLTLYRTLSTTAVEFAQSHQLLPAFALACLLSVISNGSFRVDKK
jgi:hypothetical protein